MRKRTLSVFLGNSSSKPHQPTFTFLVLLLLLLVPVCTSANYNDEQSSSSTSSNIHVFGSAFRTKASKAARVRPSQQPQSDSAGKINKEHSIPLPSPKIKTNYCTSSFSEKLATNIPGVGADSDFAQRLRRYEEEELSVLENSKPLQDGNSAGYSSSGLSWTLIWTAASFFIASTVLNPTAVWKDVITGLNALLSIHWFRLVLQPVALLDVAAAAHLLSKTGTVESFQKHIWPTVVSTMKALLLAEVWAYFWKTTWKTMSFVVEKTNLSYATNNSPSSTHEPPDWLPEWMSKRWNDANSLIDGVMKRGTKRIIQKVLQKNIQEAFVILASQGVGIVKEQLYSATSRSTATIPRER
eukprot:CAMPEP_0198136696 /NCGR_PEP_ID=MMETSP1443-20131203/317_1 /TAXON_ID=186043 /ORGANISM="Entomoneis sp., Strain CCMP2396" /LENGTH=354 /DNA_ID=CAMNT_0043797955 /DNA_START=172 /DNA_END=1236 /DNA_ORIENTATION=-